MAALAVEDEAGLERALARDRSLNRILHALDYRFQDDPPDVELAGMTMDDALDEAEAVADRLRQSSEMGVVHPQPELLQVTLQQAESGYRAHADMLSRISVGDTSAGNTDYLFRQARALEHMMEPAVMAWAERLLS